MEGKGKIVYWVLDYVNEDIGHKIVYTHLVMFGRIPLWDLISAVYLFFNCILFSLLLHPVILYR